MYQYLILGPYQNKSVDYPDYAKKLAKRVKDKKSDIGILSMWFWNRHGYKCE